VVCWEFVGHHVPTGGTILRIFLKTLPLVVRFIVD
jgi:hypothetical protein